MHLLRRSPSKAPFPESWVVLLGRPPPVSPPTQDLPYMCCRFWDFASDRQPRAKPIHTQVLARQEGNSRKALKRIEDTLLSLKGPCQHQERTKVVLPMSLFGHVWGWFCVWFASSSQLGPGAREAVFALQEGVGTAEEISRAREVPFARRPLDPSRLLSHDVTLQVDQEQSRTNLLQLP